MIDSTSKPQAVEGVYILVKSDKTDILVEAQTTLFDAVQLPKIADGVYLLAGRSASYAVNVYVSPGFEKKTIKVDLGKVEPPPIVNPPPGTDDLDYAKLESISKEAADSLNDPTTKKALADGLGSLNLSNMDLEATKQLVSTKTRDVLLKRAPQSKKIGWTKWTLAVEAWQKANVKTAEQHQKSIAAIVRSLQ